ncbi:baeRF7 domain-containing protein [Lentiprolixibacter aurantiacus]|uniref:Uncharacterized protein n=1 Tax=Lentiprolixibacter aurantiacus TaxID=2993939 RepID=A0AAE3SPK4_9FLAO|nr:hypothetical protein [Lentiprolixibacter aurantiacus]MCX2720764.1 hypothetical protein [Lentiprolixibacter aurantiacus]
MRSISTKPLPLNTFKNLSETRNPFCVSIYLPMFKKGKEQNQEMGPATLKSQIHRLEKTLGEYGMKDPEIKEYLKPLHSLVENRELWRNPGDGLAIFLEKESGLQYYLLPFSFEPVSYVSNHFYMLPLYPMYHQNGEYFILGLSRDYVRLYKADRYGLRDLNLETHAPEQLEEVVGYDYQQKTLQFRSGQAGYAQGSFHGHGEGKDDEKIELIKFFKEIDKGVRKLLGESNAPLIVAGVSRWHSLYKEVNSYPNLYKEALWGDPEFKDVGTLQQEAWELVAPYFKATLDAKIRAYRENVHRSNTSHQIADILRAVKDGRVDTLFIQKGTDEFGTYSEKGCIILDSEKTKKNISIYNRMARDTFLKGGKVYILDKGHMPYSKRPINALFRY